jgi:hypothetical protein
MPKHKKFKSEYFTISIEEGNIFCNIIHKELTAESIDLLIEKGLKMVDENHPDLVLIDISSVGFKDLEKHRAKLVELSKTRKFRKSAMIFNSGLQKVLINFIFTASQINNLKCFTSKKEALAWLKS